MATGHGLAADGRRGLPDLAIIVLPMLRPLRLLPVVTFLNVANRSATSTLRGRVATYVGRRGRTSVVVAAVAALDAERGELGATISSFGDRYPVTTTGRFVAVGLMIGGIALLGTVTASLASWLSDRVREDTDTNAEISPSSASCGGCSKSSGKVSKILDPHTVSGRRTVSC